MDRLKENKKLIIGLFIGLFIFWFGQNIRQTFLGAKLLQTSVKAPRLTDNQNDLYSAGQPEGYSVPAIPQRNYAPNESQDRLVIEESTISMVVSEVPRTTDEIIARVQNAGGFMVTSSLTHPQEAPYASLVVRVPSEKLHETLEYFRNLAVRVASENIRGTDVTAEFENLEARIETHQKTKAKFEEILNQAIEIPDILQVNRELINLQHQIDALVGRQKYLSQTAKLAKITLYLSTDEWVLPYTPAKPFRPKVIFKQAMRSLILTLRGLAEKLIWIMVYGVIWAPVLWLITRLWRKKKVNR
ncbi:MAG: DUF4349 domain-containing protein [Candidatus Pacebacteria bacterium]|nr:DUF4349 domain-containing protein [Candidatus Paceibacterota bacterium]